MSLERHGRLHSRGAPASGIHLNCEWKRQPELHRGRLHFRSEGAKSGLYMFYGDDGAWCIGPELGGLEVYARAASTSLHPCTVEERTWHLVSAPACFLRCPEFELVCDGPNTEQVPTSQSACASLQR